MKAPSTSSRRFFWLAILGNCFEHYEGALFALLSSYLAMALCPGKTAIDALITTYALIPLGMLARPIGAFIFGVIGDRYGRGTALCMTLCGMAFVSLCFSMIPFIPSVASHIFFVFAAGRLLQNFFTAGETIGGAIYLLENSEKKQRSDLLSGLYSASSVAGILLASLLVSLLGFFQKLEKCWPILYLVGLMSAVFGICLRKSALITSVNRKPFSLKTYINIFWTYRQPLFLIALVSGFSYANYSIAMIFTAGFAPLIASASSEQMLHVNTILLIADLLLLPLFGWLSTIISKERLMLSAALMACLTAAPLFFMMKGGSLAIVALVRSIFVVIGTAFAAPFYALVQELVPKEHRYFVIGLGYAIGSQVIGGPTCSISLWLFDRLHSPIAASLYWLSISAITTIVMAKLVRQKQEVY